MFIVLGTTAVDQLVTGVSHLPSTEGDEFTSGSLVFCRNPLGMVLGGNGANTVYVLANLGVPTALCSATGTDELSDILVGWLQEKPIDLRGLVRKPDGTAVDTIILDDQRSRIAFYYPGYFPQYQYSEFPAELLDEANVLLITGYVLLPGFRPQGYQKLLQDARQKNIITALDIGPAIGNPAALHEITPMLPDIDYLIANEYELSVCAGVTGVTAGAQKLLDAGASCVVIKQGAEGASLFKRQHTITVDGFPVDVTHTVGAGDSFNAGFLYGVQQGMELWDAAYFGNATAALVLQSGRGIPGAPTLAQVQAWIERFDKVG